MIDSETLQLGALATRDLFAEFLSTVFGTGPTGLTSVTCGVGEGSVEAKFFLDPSEPGPCARTDWVVLAIMATVFHCFSWLPRWMIYEPLANKRMMGHKGWDRDEARRFSQTCASAQTFFASTFFGLRIMMSKDWLLERSEWAGYFQFVDADFKFYYLLYCARFFSDIVSIFFELRKRVRACGALHSGVPEIRLTLTPSF